MTCFHLATGRNVLRYDTTRSDLLVAARAQPAVTFKPPKKRGKLKFYWTIWSTLQKKKSMQHISGLWGTSWIYIDISTFLEKLFKVILFLIIPIDSIKYLVSLFLFNFLPNLKWATFLFFFWDCFESAKHKILIVLCSIYTQGCMIIENGNWFVFILYVAQQISVQTFVVKGFTIPTLGQMEERKRERSDKRHT